METNKRRVLIISYISLAAMISLFLSGCAGKNYVWYQPYKNMEAFQQDNIQCEEESVLYAKHMSKPGNMNFVSERMQECMAIRGYVKILEADLPKGAPVFKSAID